MSEIEQRVIDRIQQRAAVGKKKYGTTMARQDITFAGWLRNLIEELLDAVIYAEKLLSIIEPPTQKPEDDED